jgi:hypothetical protein
VRLRWTELSGRQIGLPRQVSSASA